MKTNIALTALLALGISNAFHLDAYSQPIDVGVVIAPLKGKYPYDSIYLTNIALNDLTVHLSDQAKYSDLEKIIPRKDILAILKKYLNSNLTSRAFLQIDIANLRAGYKTASDKAGTITSIAWDKDQVALIAIFIDNYLNGLIAIADLGTQLRARKTKVDSAWNKLESLRRDPYVPTVSLRETLRDFTAFVEQNPTELTSLQTSNPKMHLQIAGFSSDYKVAQSKSSTDVKDIVTRPVFLDFYIARDKNILDAYSKSVGLDRPDVAKQVDRVYGLKGEQLRRENAMEFRSK